jgi:lipoprotein-anchoring transpeptidase ErfK/SrfK
MSEFSRRSAMAAMSALLLAGCATRAQNGLSLDGADPASRMYAAVPDEAFAIPAVDLRLVPGEYWRQLVGNPTGEPAGTVVVDTPNRYLYLVREDGTALRYGIGVGREGFSWSGEARIVWKRKWPTWTPPATMIARQPELEKFRDGMAPGLDNPLGARALYIFEGDRDTLYRLHGTNEPQSIGKAVSSGCIRLLNQDIIDLYDRVPNGTRIVVIPDRQTPPETS